MRRRALLFAAALALLHLVLALLVFEPAPHTGGDNAVYVTLARSLLEDGSYRNLHEPGRPLHTQYPPGFPLLLALALLLGLLPWVQLKLAIVAFSALAIAASFLWIVRRGRPLLALGAGVLLAVSPAALEQSHWVLSDTPFWAFTMLALVGFERLARGRRDRFALAVAFTFAAYFTRSAGLPLVLAALLFLALRRRWREAAALALVIGVPALLWSLRAGSGGADYVNQFWYINPYAPELGTIGPLDLLRRIAANSSRYLTLHLPVVLVGLPSPVPITLAATITVLTIFGWARWLPRRGVAELLLPLYLGLILIWPAVWSGERFLLPVMPLILFYAGDAFVRVVRYLDRRVTTGAGVAAVLAIVLLAAPALAFDIRRGTTCTSAYRAGQRYACLPPEWLDFYVTAEWAGERLPADAIVLSRKPSLFHVASGLQSDYYPLAAVPDELFRRARTIGARYVIFDRMDTLAEAYLAPILLQRPDAFCLLIAAGESGTVMFGILPDAERIADSPPGLAAGLRTFTGCGREFLR